MIRTLFSVVLMGWLGVACPSWASPVVVTDIPAIHSLAATVMGDTGKPELLLRAGASPHDYSMRPSEARLLRKADILIWTSEALTPWLPKTLKALAPELNSIELLQNENSIRLARRESANFEHDDHDHEHDHGHDDSASDPHAWLSTDNAQLWLQLIAEQLSALDPDNAASYNSNAARGIQSLATLNEAIDLQLASVRGKPFVVFHDSYHYFEDQFHLPATAAISLSDGSAPGIRQLDKLRQLVSRYPDICVFSEPQFSERMVITITDELEVGRGVLDPLGASLEPGAELYGQLIQNLANSLHECLSGEKQSVR